MAADGEVEDYRVTIETESPSVVDVVINGGDAQRSMLTQIVVTFDQVVDASASAFSILDRASSTVLDSLVVDSSIVAGVTVSSLTFAPGNLVETRGNGVHTLRDGRFELNIRGSEITSFGGGASMQQDFVFGDNAADAFFRLFGDSDGDGDVDARDLGQLGLTFLKSASDVGFNSVFDRDGDGDVDGRDHGQFSHRFLKSLPF